MSGTNGRPRRMKLSAAERSQGRWGAVVANLLKPVTRGLTGRSYAVPDHIPTEGPAIVAAYHASYIDPVIVGLHVWERGRLPHFLAKDSLFNGALGTVMRTVGQIPVVRGSEDASLALLHAREAIQRGEVVVIYPEGTLTKDPELWPGRVKSGTARLAMETGAPVIPLAHWGAHEVLQYPKKLPTPRPGEHVRVRTGPPVDLSDLGTGAEAITPETLRVANERILRAIAVELATLRNEDVPARFGSGEAPASPADISDASAPAAGDASEGSGTEDEGERR
ncbi:lysophospholipid acyltransferase family protein [Sediminivirga luteola]|uniref:lysophospholipid acyltransferase family protein n=1 Tax=Sediminivirga luteola TaxID=1774748 RepID=UPI001F563734|nr:lysophospholipid acyltransferase family protein [Sediminivirga luteola]MCI2264611.1 1-acyl-sn-glycerol-3-phosphate acyltransferase [Sediminivirga luteola]